MSAEAMTAVWEHGEGTPGQRNTLLALANRADEHGICWPGIPELVTKTKMTRRGVKYALRALEKSGQLVRLEGEQGGRGITPLYWIKLPGLDGDTGSARRRRKGAIGSNPGQEKGADGDEKGRNRKQERANPTSPEPLREPTEEPTAPPPDPLVTEFEAWLSYHWATTGMNPPREGTSRERLFWSYRARRKDGYQRHELELAVEGAWADDYRREHGYYDPASVLRQSKIDKLIHLGKRARAVSEKGADKWAAWVAKELPEFTGIVAQIAASVAQMLAGANYEITPDLVRERVKRRLGPDAEAA